MKTLLIKAFPKDFLIIQTVSDKFPNFRQNLVHVHCQYDSDTLHNSFLQLTKSPHKRWSIYLCTVKSTLIGCHVRLPTGFWDN